MTGLKGQPKAHLPCLAQTAPPSPHQYFQLIASQIQLFQLDQEGKRPAEQTASLLWPRGPRPSAPRPKQVLLEDPRPLTQART